MTQQEHVLHVEHDNLQTMQAVGQHSVMLLW